MIPWEEIGRAEIPGQKKEVTLRRRGSEFSIRTFDTELMNSRRHGSEESLAELACHRFKKSNPNILIGGLGMGYTLAAAIEHTGLDSSITVSELIPAVVTWNREHLGHLAGMPLNNPKINVKIEDVAKTIGKEKSAWDIILLDVDNGPDGLTQKSNDRLYSISGLKKSFFALRPKGILGIWSSKGDATFSKRLEKSGFKVDIKAVKARKSEKKLKHTIWLAEKP
jgi:spermidine synthase